MRALSQDEILEGIEMDAAAQEAMEKHQRENAPRSQSERPLENQFWLKPNRWNGPRGVADKDLTVSEKKCIEGAERNRGRQLSFAERKSLLTRFRADMAKFQTAKPIRITKLPTN
jgi:hypothetical protein